MHIAVASQALDPGYPANSTIVQMKVAPARGEWRVTPAYDLPSSYPYGDTTIALPINDRTREDIGRRDFLALGAAVGLKPRAVARALDELCVGVDAWIDGLADLPFDEGRLIELRRSVEYRRGRLVEGVGNQTVRPPPDPGAGPPDREVL